MEEVKEICTVYLGSSSLDNDYTLYEDGRIKHFYDRNQHCINQEDWIEASKISDSVKQSLIEKCPEEAKEKARKLLGL